MKNHMKMSKVQLAVLLVGIALSVVANYFISVYCHFSKQIYASLLSSIPFVIALSYSTRGLPHKIKRIPIDREFYGMLLLGLASCLSVIAWASIFHFDILHVKASIALGTLLLVLAISYSIVLFIWKKFKIGVGSMSNDQ